MEFQITKMDYNKYDVRLSSRAKEKIAKILKRAYWMGLFAASAFIYTILKIDEKSK